jgi:hypothetical protein
VRFTAKPTRTGVEGTGFLAGGWGGYGERLSYGTEALVCAEGSMCDEREAHTGIVNRLTRRDRGEGRGQVLRLRLGVVFLHWPKLDGSPSLRMTDKRQS